MATYTTNYNLPKYEASDLPNLLDEYNSAMDKIDAQIKSTDNAATQAGTAAGTAATTAQQALTLAQTNESAITSIESDVTSIESEQSSQAASISDHEQRITAVQGDVTELTSKVDQNTAGLATKAPIMHASTASTYGLGSAANFGHVKLSDEAGATGAEQGVAASPLALASIISQYLTSDVVHTETVTFSGQVNAKYVFNVVTYGKIVAISMSNSPEEGGTQITSTGAASSGWQTLSYQLPANLRPSRNIFLNPFTYIYSSGVTINMLVRIAATGTIDVDITTTSGIGSPLTIGGNVMFIAAGTSTL